MIVSTRGAMMNGVLASKFFEDPHNPRRSQSSNQRITLITGNGSIVSHRSMGTDKLVSSCKRSFTESAETSISYSLSSSYATRAVHIHIQFNFLLRERGSTGAIRALPSSSSESKGMTPSETLFFAEPNRSSRGQRLLWLRWSKVNLRLIAGNCSGPYLESVAPRDELLMPTRQFRLCLAVGDSSMKVP